MSYQNNPNPDDPYDRGGQQPDQGPSGGYPSPADPHQGGYPGQGGYGQPQPGQPGGYGVPHGQGGYPGQPGGYAPGPGFGDSSAVTGQPNQDERTMGLLSHLSGILFSVLGPLVLYLIKKDESPFVRDQTAQALNFQILLLIGYLISMVLYVILIGALLQLAFWVCAIVFGIMGAMAANKGEWYRYPFNVSWVK
ncbi:DUF4870 domain-containing protein [Nocardiopsis metallicus]|uniref:DUF4870 domain-containing protein n=1 Tax=Nocardiopsis metallicus TaxID=179819 RepID=A0A840VZA1_9ACTN|nr:DUF4870 domain-containing protein [Nocardiopsis metallicus]MBB5489044.1 hypothetical protein [Nocardiopsis metallicus]